MFLFFSSVVYLTFEEGDSSHYSHQHQHHGRNLHQKQDELTEAVVKQTNKKSQHNKYPLQNTHKKINNETQKWPDR